METKHCQRCGNVLMGFEQKGDVCNRCLDSSLPVTISPTLRARVHAYADKACGGNVDFVVRRALIAYLQTAEKEANWRASQTR